MRNVLALLACAACAHGAMSKQIASYDIKATLDTKSHIITGSEVLTWVNDSPDTVPALRFHLYMNAFSNSKSTFFRESGGRLRNDEFKGDEWGWIDIKRLEQPGAGDLTGAIRFIHPDDDNADDRTVIEVPLPKPVKPGETIQISVNFETKLPNVFARTGFHKDFYLAGQWFPKLGVWEKAGFRYSTTGAWNCHQFHANSEFFANFGRYHVELTVPAEMVVGATGEMKSKVESRGRTTYTFEQEDVTDFAWTVQPTYLREERMFIADKETTPQEIAAVSRLHGIPESEARLSDVKMIALVQPEHREQMDRHFAALKAALKWFGLWYGRYPYKTITVVDPAANASGAGGMEYPTFITAGTTWKLPPESHLLEEVTVHEFGHQFWMQLVATNEFEESPMDEGFNTYSTSLVMDKVFGGMGELPIKLFGIDLWKMLKLPGLSDSSLNRAQFLLMPSADNMIRNSWQYYNSSSYGINSYPKMGVTLDSLQGILGADTMARVMRTYHQRWRFNHPTARDFQKVANEVSGRNLDWFFDQFFFGNRQMDYSIGNVVSAQKETPMGALERGGKRVIVTRKEAQAQDDKDDDNKAFKKQYECTVKVRRIGDAVAPVDVWIHFKDGGTEKRTWDGQYRWVKYTFLRGSEIDWVQVDPERKYRLDISYANNSWQADYNKKLSTTWTMQLLFWIQNLSLWMTSLA
ncbi:M1 family metallopeptidase [uncultured Paludibaculum sp.]|uniref:M1 family metallopeptidase n=1 Tax=uncultured Paludibaculum sp. TaxID=1765020 RepID=UPI002AAC08D5|nr:M1 family metallopeptidase [uncultured Paludibaculum sp.]